MEFDSAENKHLPVSLSNMAYCSNGEVWQKHSAFSGHSIHTVCKTV